jgi:capsular exopolysaccharide synthesis family protein
MASEFQKILQTKGVAGGKNAKEILLKYLSYYPLFLLCLALSISGGYAYIRYAVPLYQSNTAINVKGETSSSKGGSGSANSDLISNAMNGGRPVINLDNELARLRSARLMERVVRKSDLNISYYKQGKIRKTDIYHEAPFRLLPRDLQDSSRSISMTLIKPTNWGVTVRYGDDQHRQLKAVPWNRPFNINGNTYVLAPLSNSWSINDQFIIDWHPVVSTVYEIMPKVSVGVIGKTSNIGLKIAIENPYRGEDILNKMVSEFIQMNLDDQNLAAQSKIYFIEERLGKISSELTGVEKNLATYQGSNLLVNGQAASTTGEPIAVAQKAIADINTQLRVLSMTQKLLTDPASQNKVLPSTLGFEDAVLSGLIANYNNLLLTRERERPLLAANSLVLKDLDHQVEAVKSNILANLKSISDGLQIQVANHQRQGKQYKASLSSLPEKERGMGEIFREKSVKENLYMYLLQRREEAALSKTSTSPYEQIDMATSYGPVSPNKRSIYQYAILLGLIIPVGIIILRDTLSDKVNGREQVEKMTGLSIAAEVSFVKKAKRKILPALEGGLIGEQFRNMRANFGFLQKDVEKQVILITSSISGEGKSFISQNLAAIIAKSGKKVALLQFDLRKPATQFIVSANERGGITEYLNGEATLSEIVQTTERVPNLYIYPVGTVVSEAGELMLNEKVSELFNALKQEYDVIVVDAAPVGLVSDALILQQYCNKVGYVIRLDYTSRKDISTFTTLMDNGKLPNNVRLLLNDVKSGMKYGYGNKKYNAYFNRK